MSTLSDIRAIVAVHRFRFTDEKELQEGVAIAFASHGIAFEREVRIAPGDVIDFLVGRVGVEVKIDHSLSLLTRQLHRYAKSDRLDSLVLVTSRRRLANLPPTMLGKPLDAVVLSGGL